MSRRSTVFIANLPPSVEKQDIEDVFAKFGPINRVDLKTKGGDGPIAFVEYEDIRDCEDAVKGRNGYDMDGFRLRCDFSRGGRGNDSRGIRGSRPPGPPSRRTEWRVRVTGLPRSGSWQDLKDHMRSAGDVCFSEVYGDGSGVVEYNSYEDMKVAIRKIDDTKFKSHEGDSAYISVEEDRGQAKSSGIPRGGRYRDNDRGRDRSPRRYTNGGGRKRSPSYSPPRFRRRHSPPYRDRSRSHSRSRSRSPRRRSP